MDKILLFRFVSHQQNLYFIHLFQNLFFNTYTTINENNKITTSHWLFQSKLIYVQKWFKKFFNNFICFAINHDFYVISFWMPYTLFINILIAIVTWIFHVSDFLTLFIIPFKYLLSLILCRYFQLIAFCFCHLFVSCQYYYYSKNHLLLFLVNIIVTPKTTYS